MRMGLVMPFRVLLLAVLSATMLSAQAPATLRIGLWTLWHDKDLIVSPSTESGGTLRLCAICAAVPLTHPIHIHASGARLSLDASRQAAEILPNGPVNLAAHGETLTLRNPLRISARNGELVIAVTLPVESYVERVVASESGPADTPESLKALAIVVRSFALHQPHAHADYDLCDSTHCQLLHWRTDFRDAPSQTAHAATLATAGETLWFHGRPAAAFFHQDCGGRPPHPIGSLADSLNQTPHPPMPWLVSRPTPTAPLTAFAPGPRHLPCRYHYGARRRRPRPPRLGTLTVARRGDSARAVTLRAGSTESPAEDFRLAVGRAFGWGHILSSWFEISPQGDHFFFNGRGSGHGVGLCQPGRCHGRRGPTPLKSSPSTSLAPMPPTNPTGHPGNPLPSGAGRPARNPRPIPCRFHLPRSTRPGRSPIPIRPPASAPSPSAPILPPRPFATPPSPPGLSPPSLKETIATQPLAYARIPQSASPTLRHEFFHGCSKATPRPALRSGSAKALSKSGATRSANCSTAIRDSRPGQLPASRTLLRSPVPVAHRSAAWYASRLIDRYGRDQVLLVDRPAPARRPVERLRRCSAGSDLSFPRCARPSLSP